MIIIFAHKLVDDTKQELLSEIEKFRADNHIKEKVIFIPKILSIIKHIYSPNIFYTGLYGMSIKK